MTPERNANKVGKIDTRNKSTIAKNIFRLGLFTSMLFGCVPIEANVNPAANPSPGGETSTLPSEFTETPLPLPTETVTKIPTATLTPEPTVIVNPDIEVVDEELAEQIKSVMPSMWMYDREQKNLLKDRMKILNFRFIKEQHY